MAGRNYSDAPKPMLNNKRLTVEEKQQIKDLLSEGMSMNQTAKEVGCSTAAVSRLAKKEGIPANAHLTRMLQGAHDYTKERRRMVFNYAFERGLELLESDRLDSRGYREILTGMAIMTDKRRLEDGEATQHTKRTEAGADAIDWQAEFAKADQLAREAGKKLAPPTASPASPEPSAD